HALDPARMAAERADLVGRALPDLHGAVRTPPGQNVTVFGMEHDTLHGTGGIRQLMEQLPGAGVPDLDDLIVTTGGQELSILADRHTEYIPLMVKRFCDLLTC